MIAAKDAADLRRLWTSGEEYIERATREMDPVPTVFLRSSEVEVKLEIGTVRDETEGLDGKKSLDVFLTDEDEGALPIGIRCPHCHVYHVGVSPIKPEGPPNVATYYCPVKKKVIGTRTFNVSG